MKTHTIRKLGGLAWNPLLMIGILAVGLTAKVTATESSGATNTQIDKATSTTDTQKLTERASLDPVKLAARANALKEQRSRIEAAVVEDPAITTLRLKTIELLAAAETETQRREIMDDFIVIMEANNARKQLLEKQP